MKSLTLLLALILFGLTTGGCGKEQPPAEPPPVDQPDTTAHDAEKPSAAALLTTEELDKIGKASKPFKLALVVKTRNNPFFDPMIKAAEAEAKNLGVELDVQAPPQETDKERQFAIVQDLIARGVDALLIAPADSKGIVPALKQAQDKGILVVNLDNRVDKATAASAGLALGGYVGADNEQGGKLAGEAMVQALGGKGKVKVAILEGIRGADNAEARKRGFEAGVQGKLEVAVKDSAEWDTQKAYAKFQSMLAANKDLQGVFCANDKMALGAIKAIEEAGRKGKITVIGYDNIPDVQPYLKSGEMYATIEQHPDLMGKYGVKMAVGILDGKLEKGREYLVPLEVIRP
ncbi:MAG: substrate-binding domain-containing protein [Abditibacteriales bacterium]|nr:substrate-binding domain-containing protein [Abditibacteriales bacterium]MDW8367983.1 substrate-binding domain-containing protein [Abditibacteriales bacterium]